MSGHDPRLAAIKAIQQVHSSMRDFCLEAGIDGDHFDKPMANIEHEMITFDLITAELAFLTGFRDSVYTDALTFKRQKSDEWWNNLVVIFGNQNLPEQNILKAKFKAMRDMWRKRYGKSKSKQPVDKDQDRGVPDELPV